MRSKKDIKEELNELSTLSDVSKAYALIASMRMKRIRNSVLMNREFLEKIDDVFQEVFYSYQQETLKLAKKRKPKEGLTFLSHNGRIVSVFLASNARLYGDVVLNTFDYFLKDIEGKDVEITIVGKYGQFLFKQKFPNRVFSYFDFPDNGIEPTHLADLINHLVQYEEIRLYYPKFENIITQTPSFYRVSASTELKVKDDGRKHMSYIFEPDLEKILIFFETEIFASLFEQTIRESQLAKYAARLLAMDRAGEQIRMKKKQVEFSELKLNHYLANRKQNSIFSGIYIWSQKTR